MYNYTHFQYIYIYIYRERERERDACENMYTSTCAFERVCLHNCKQANMSEENADAYVYLQS